MKALNVAIVFDGQAEAAFNYYKSIFGGEFKSFQRLKDIPNAPPMPDDEAEKILHVSLPVGKALIMGMDMPKSRGALNAGNNFMVALDTESEEETTRLFNSLADGGSVSIPVGHQFWGAFFGMVTDKFGISWMISFAE
jgi:PhnB protein